MYGLKIGIGFVHELRSNAKVGRRIVFRYVPTYDQEGKNSGGSSRTNRSANDVLSVLSCHVETVVLLGREKVDEEIVYAYEDYEPKDSEYLNGTKGSATYREIKEWVKSQHGLSVSSLYIAQVKEKCGLEKRENFNLGEDGHRVPTCPPEKEEAILSAFRHFRMI